LFKGWYWWILFSSRVLIDIERDVEKISSVYQEWLPLGEVAGLTS
jgi:hypothetical protein